MSQSPGEARKPRDEAAAARAEEETLRERWEATQLALRERFDAPIVLATEITQKTLAWFPIRVWRHFLQHNGFLLAASISYQSLFAIFAVIYFAFAAVGIWLGASEAAITGLIDLINRYIPGLISDDGLVHPDQVTAVATGSSGVLAITGAIAFVVAIWTAIGFVTFTRRAVRDIFGLPFDRRNYFILKTRDFVAALAFGVALVLGALLGYTASGALDFVLTVLGLTDRSFWFQVLIKLLSFAVAFAINSAALAGLFRFLTGTTLTWRTIWPGSLLGGAAIAVLQVGVGLLFLYTPSNPLLATFSVLVGFLLWFRLIGIVILVAASWIAVAARDRDIPIAAVSEAERLAAEHRALVTAAHVRVRTAQEARDAAPWYRRWSAERAVRDAEDELAQVEATLQTAPVRKGSLFE
ncbi:YhjD/YihY/BrkB family envelope integrity protein [Microbacterium ulmi]|uniref:YihY/virulence factor BrkB family protein n=1 Tax=Microbacterium ulmi TaxID=179095 RepID=A0A7Y2M057_9MICO|nr:membrane protein [Microbacterium ulmi]NNH03354.1 YihY/virulence factor BrkB family protein [Microbacterium ulmi]